MASELLTIQCVQQLSRCPTTRRRQGADCQYRVGPCQEDKYVPRVERVSKQATGNKENYKRAENLIREVLRKSESLNRAQVGWRCNLVMHLRLVGILKSHVNSWDAGYLCFRVVYILKNFCLLLQNLLGVREIE